MASLMFISPLALSQTELPPVTVFPVNVRIGRRYSIHFSDGSESYTQTNSAASSVALSATPGTTCR